MGAQPQPSEEHEDGPIPEVVGRVIVVGGEHPFHVCHREAVGQRGMGPLPGGGGSGCQARRPIAAEHQETPDGSHPGAHQVAATARPPGRFLLATGGERPRL